MADGYQIRPATATDLAAMVALERLVFTDPWTESGLASLLDGIALVGTQDARVLGYVISRQAADEAEILNLAVHPAHRRGGLGTSLVRVALGLLAGAGSRSAYLEVRASNLAARAFYGRLGFMEVGRRARYYRQPVEEALVLALRLGPETGPA